MSYIGQEPGQLRRSLFEYTATSGQTVFGGADGSGNVLSYSIGNVDVFVNGILQSTSSYTANNSTSIVFGSGITAGYKVSIIAYGSFSLSELGGAVRWDLNQGLSGSAQTQARQNIGAHDASNLTTGTVADARYSQSVYPSTSGTDNTTDFNTLTSTGWQSKIYLGTNANGPGDSSYYWVQNLVYGGAQITQLAFCYASPGNSIWIRGRYSGTWSAWVRLARASELSAYAPLAGATFTGNINAPQLFTSDSKAILNYNATYGTGTFYSKVGGGAVIGYSENTSIYGRIGYGSYSFYGNGPIYATGNATIDGVGTFGGVVFANSAGISYGDTSAYYSFQNAAKNLERGYVGIVRSPWTDVEMYSTSGSVLFRESAGLNTTLSSTGNTMNRYLRINGPTTGATYALDVRSNNASGGAVLGYSQDNTVYGILGYQNTYAFLGNGIVSTTGPITTSGGYVLASNGYVQAGNGDFYGNSTAVSIGPNGTGTIYFRPYGPTSSTNQAWVGSGGDFQATGHVYAGNGASLLHSNGNVYGTTWGGYLSSWLGNNVVYNVNLAGQIGNMAAGSLGTYGFLRNVIATPGTTAAGSSLYWTCTEGTTGNGVASGSWKAVGGTGGGTHGTLWLRYA